MQTCVSIRINLTFLSFTHFFPFQLPQQSHPSPAKIGFVVSQQISTESLRVRESKHVSKGKQTCDWCKFHRLLFDLTFPVLREIVFPLNTDKKKKGENKRWLFFSVWQHNSFTHVNNGVRKGAQIFWDLCLYFSIFISASETSRFFPSPSLPLRFIHDEMKNLPCTWLTKHIFSGKMIFHRMDTAANTLPLAFVRKCVKT